MQKIKTTASPNRCQLYYEMEHINLVGIPGHQALKKSLRICTSSLL